MTLLPHGRKLSSFGYEPLAGNFHQLFPSGAAIVSNFSGFCRFYRQHWNFQKYHFLQKCLLGWDGYSL